MKLLELLGLPVYENQDECREAIGREIEERMLSKADINKLHEEALNQLPIKCVISELVSSEKSNGVESVPKEIANVIRFRNDGSLNSDNVEASVA